MEPPPSPHAIGAVCCMCGDAGLPHELLRCKLCRVRLQHRYCSDLYPRATAYRRCNWCLREPAHAVSSKPTDKRKAVAAMTAETSTSEDEGERRQLLEAGCATTRSSRPAAEVGQPLKKQKTDERAPLPPSPGAAKGNNGNKRHKADERAELPPSPGATAKENHGNKKKKANERAELPPSPGASARGNNGNKKQKVDERAELPSSPGASARGNNGNKKQNVHERAELPPSPGATAKGNYGDKKPMQAAGKLTRPGRVKVRRYKLLAEVISC